LAEYEVYWFLLADIDFGETEFVCIGVLPDFFDFAYDNTLETLSSFLDFFYLGCFKG